MLKYLWMSLIKDDLTHTGLVIRKFSTSGVRQNSSPAKQYEEKNEKKICICHVGLVREFN